MSSSSTFLRLMSYAWPHRVKIIVATLCSIANMIFDIMPEVLIGVAINVVVNKEHSVIAALGFPDMYHQLYILGGITFLIWVCESVFEYIYAILWRNIGQTIQHELRLDAYEHIQQLDMAYYENVSTGKLISVLNDDINQLDRFLDMGINKFLQLGTSTLIIGGIFFYLSPIVALFVLIPVPFVFLTGVYFQKLLRPRYAAAREKASLLAARLVNNITGIVTVKSYTSENFEYDRIGHDSREYKIANRHAIAVNSAFMPLVRIILAVGFVATMILGGYQVMQGSLDVGAYSLLVFQTQRFLWPFTELAEMIDDYERTMVSARRVFDLLDMPIKIVGGDDHLKLSKVEGDIAFKDVSFIYPDGTQIFNKLTLEVKPGLRAAFVGTTGAGKSTLIKLLLRFYDPTHGHILLDGHDTKELDLTDLRRSIGLVSQEVFLFHGTVAENIAYGAVQADQKAIEEAANIAEAHDFIMELPEGYQTIIGERGQRLSGGQRQRVSIARAILKNPPIYIFDEATSALDVETEEAIQRSLEKMVKGHTVLMIAHRLSTIRNADIIFVLHEGSVAESGTHAELIAKNGMYARLWRVQTGER